MKVLIAQINPTIGDLAGNAAKIIAAISKGKESGASLVVFPELALSGYPPDDFLLLPHFMEAVEHHLAQIAQAATGITAIVGTPRRVLEAKEKQLANSAAILAEGKIAAFRDKTLLPVYDVFDERRYFDPAAEISTIEVAGKRVGITICEDIWQHSAMADESASYPRDPVMELKALTPDLVVNLSASPFRMQKCYQRLEVCRKAAATLHCPVLLCNQVGGNDNLIFDGYSLYVGSGGELLANASGFQEELLLIDLKQTMEPFAWNVNDQEDLYKALVLGVRDYFHKLGFKKACLGISGGIDSAVVAAIAQEALGKENVLGIMMPSRFSSLEGIADGRRLIENLGIAHKEISIESPFQEFLDLLAPHFGDLPFDATEENIQARIRGIILMAFSNKFGHVVLSTGNKSELAMGYATLYGDMVGGLAVLSDVTKRNVYALAEWINRASDIIPENIIRKPPSAELREGQLDTDSLPEYEIVDNVLTDYVERHLSPQQIAERHGYARELVDSLIKKIHLNEYKRRQSAPGLKVSPRAFSIGRRFPIVQRWVS